jgi:hypothetical protein
VLERLEATLARREAREYFQQSQLVLTDMMEQCDDNKAFSWKDRMDMRRIETLLNKNRYLSSHTDDPDLMSSQKLLKKIEWLLYEIILNKDDNSCDKLEQLQTFIKEEKLLLKIRLAGKELSSGEV